MARYAGCMSRIIRKTRDVSVLLYHCICPTKYRGSVIDAKVDAASVETCEGIAEHARSCSKNVRGYERYEIEFLGIGADKIHVHF